MRFPARDIETYARPVEGESLSVGDTYFAVQYLDEGMTIPVVEPLVFLGRDLFPGDDRVFYFQDAESHRNGLRFPRDREGATVYAQKDLNHVFVYERALDLLMLCSLRRGGVPGA